MKYLYTRNDHYRLFMEKNNNERLKKNLKIIPSTKFNKVFEVFDRIIDTEYKVINKIIDNKKLKKCIFKTTSGNNYRLDLLLDYEANCGWTNHISFTTNDISNYNDENYENLTDKNEMIEILNRIKFIIKDLLENGELEHNNFCVGGAELEQKNNIYKNFLRIVVGDSGFDKVDIDGYSTGWVLVFKV